MKSHGDVEIEGTHRKNSFSLEKSRDSSSPPETDYIQAAHIFDSLGYIGTFQAITQSETQCQTMIRLRLFMYTHTRDCECACMCVYVRSSALTFQ